MLWAAQRRLVGYLPCSMQVPQGPTATLNLQKRGKPSQALDVDR